MVSEDLLRRLVGADASAPGSDVRALSVLVLGERSVLAVMAKEFVMARSPRTTSSKSRTGGKARGRSAAKTAASKKSAAKRTSSKKSSAAKTSAKRAPSKKRSAAKTTSKRASSK